MLPLDVAKPSLVLVSIVKVVGNSILCKGDVGSLCSGVSLGNEIVSLVDSKLGINGDMVVFEALSWVIVLRGGRRAFILGLDP